MAFLVPALSQYYFRGLKGETGPAGVCFQSTSYTCIPAATVTALRRLGLEAEEGEIAILARMQLWRGASFSLLQAGLEKRYGAQGLRCASRRFHSIEDLKNAGGITLVAMPLPGKIGHCVAVIEVTDKDVVLGDPNTGLRKMPHEDFLRAWDHVGLVLSRDRGKEAGGTP